MKALIWVLFGVVALLWTGAALLAAELTQWAAAELAAGGATAVATEAVAQLPAWLTAWIDPALLRTLQDAALWTAQALREAAPWIGSALGWVVPVIWFVWGLGVLGLLLLAGGSHWLAGWAAGRLRTT